NSVEKLSECEPRDLLNFTNDNAELAKSIIDGAREYLEGLREMTTSDSDAQLTPEAAEFLKNAEEIANRLAGKTFSAAPEDAADPDAVKPSEIEVPEIPERNNPE
ncbi:MAG TPA: hypothetical protein PKH51_11815, partial [Candidatus Sumerlaeota bacterium]|nr:hypothetical protein [Candidatus Sumerlaeota bacterium]